MASRFRFDPPPLDVSRELAWVVSRAFGPDTDESGGDDVLDVGQVIELADGLDLTARIGARIPREILDQELGEEATGRFFEAQLQIAARSLIVGELCRKVSDIGAELDLPVVFLKGAALLLTNRLPTGARGMTDIDALTRDRDAERLQRRLKQTGWSEMPGPSGEHQLQMLTHRSGLGLEVHTMVLGVRVARAGSASAEDLLAGEMCVQLPDLSGESFVPTDSLLLAHLLVHGIAQHGLNPLSYPMTRLITDANDLCGERKRWDDLLPEAMGWIDSDVSQEEAEAVRDLALRLGGGEDPAAIAGSDDPPGRLLRHILVGSLDNSYRDGLRLRGLANPVGARSQSRTLFRNAFQTVWLTRPQVEMLYGTPRTSLGYWGWRLWRPFDLVLRAGRYGRAWVADRLRR